MLKSEPWFLPRFPAYFAQRVFYSNFFSGLRSNRTSSVSGCSAPLSLLYSSLLLLFPFVFFVHSGQPNWRDMFPYGVFVQSNGHSSLTGTMCYIGIGPKLWANYNFKHVIFVYTGELDPKFSLRSVFMRILRVYVICL